MELEHEELLAYLVEEAGEDPTEARVRVYKMTARECDEELMEHKQDDREMAP